MSVVVTVWGSGGMFGSKRYSLKPWSHHTSYKLMCKLCRNLPLPAMKVRFTGILVCSSFLISGCMFIVSKALLISSATVIVGARGAIWLNPFATVLFNECSSLSVQCCVSYPCCVEVFDMFAVMYISKNALLPCLCKY